LLKEKQKKRGRKGEKEELRRELVEVGGNCSASSELYVRPK